MKLVEVFKKIQESKLNFYGHLRRRDGENHLGREAMEIKGKQKKEGSLNADG